MGFDTDALSRLMQEKAVTKYRLARDIGVHATTVSNWLGGTTPNLGHVKKMADYFNVPFNVFISD